MLRGNLVRGLQQWDIPVPIEEEPEQSRDRADIRLEFSAEATLVDLGVCDALSYTQLQKHDLQGDTRAMERNKLKHYEPLCSQTGLSFFYCMQTFGGLDRKAEEFFQGLSRCEPCLRVVSQLHDAPHYLWGLQ
eukprot:gb/GECG01004816.1/.p1 GENE.gb/GECG01004816.1/~~gb/GECG01004816.1/.p1  ORF type:complete len:133 (+),score=13.59 gb/GECG01004816.1/:1-399(+)